MTGWRCRPCSIHHSEFMYSSIVHRTISSIPSIPSSPAVRFDEMHGIGGRRGDGALRYRTAHGRAKTRTRTACGTSVSALDSLGRCPQTSRWRRRIAASDSPSGRPDWPGAPGTRCSGRLQCPRSVACARGYTRGNWRCGDRPPCARTAGRRLCRSPGPVPVAPGRALANHRRAARGTSFCLVP